PAGRTCTTTWSSPEVTATATLPVLNHIGGAWVGSSSGETVADRNPAHTGEVLGQATVSTSDDVRHAIDAAERAFREWRATPAPQRGDRKSTRLNSSHRTISYAVFCLKKK